MSSTPAHPEPERLLAEFPIPSYADWRKLVEAEQKKSDMALLAAAKDPLSAGDADGWS